MKKMCFLTALCLFSVSCTQLNQVLTQVQPGLTTGSGKITNSDNIAGLKSSLNVGIGKAVSTLSIEDGFFKNQAYKILLPKEAQTITENIRLIPGGQQLVEKAVLSLNRSAEDAVKTAAPIFGNAITNMSFTDATGILFGGNNAATEYLRKTTYAQLKAAFAPKVKASLSKPLVANVSTAQTWNSLTTTYNSVARSAAGNIAGLKTVDVNIENYVTEKALDALFSRVAAEEKSIRTNPTARINDILRKVFGQLDKK